MLAAMGGEAGCRRLSEAFYARVGGDPVLRPLFPGKSHRCAIEAFTAFLIQFLGGDEEQTQHRLWLSLRESHARFQIGSAERRAWLKHMGATLDATPLDDPPREALRRFFALSSTYIMGERTGAPEHEELAARWQEQLVLEEAIANIAAGRDREALALAPRFTARPAVFVGLLARMVQTGRADLVRFAVDAVERNPSLATRRFGGRALLHYASGAGCLEVVTSLLRLGADPNLPDAGGHTPLYRVANECGSGSGPGIVRALVERGADVNVDGGVMRATPLHMAARRGFVEIARTLLDSGADLEARDRRGETPLQRAVNCRRHELAQFFVDRGAVRAAMRR